MTVKCDQCGITSDLDETYSIVRSSFSFKKGTYCPECRSKQQLSGNSEFIWILAALIVASIAIAYFNPKQGQKFISIFVTSIFVVAMVSPHELGHALVARVLGMRVFWIVIGKGNKIANFKFFGFNWELRQFPFIGHTLFVGKSYKYYRLKSFLATLAGPAANLALIIITFQSFKVHRLFEFLSIPTRLIACFAFANLWMLLVNLTPHYQKTENGKIQSDGLALLKMPFKSEENINAELALYYALESSELRNKGQLHESIQLCQKGLSLLPDSTIILSEFAAALIDSDRLEEARSAYKAAIEKQDPNKQIEAILLANLAYVDLLIGKKELIEEADSASFQALRNCPWIQGIRGTRGLVLVELMQLDEAMSLLKDALNKNENVRNNAFYSAYLAIIESKIGNSGIAKQYLEAAIKYDPKCPFIEKARKELAIDNR